MWSSFFQLGALGIPTFPSKLELQEAVTPPTLTWALRSQILVFPCIESDLPTEQSSQPIGTIFNLK